jgi:glyoxylase-like metal-dependent hydrolase (beta-lactamase superfamily II)
MSTSLIYRITIFILFAASLLAQTRPEAHAEPLTPSWWKDLPRPGYQSLDRVAVRSDWFEVYRIRPGVFAIYEPHQYEEVIYYLIVGSKRALLFDTGIGVGDMRSLVSQLTRIPITVLNSHTHFDHIGDNWQFADVLGLDTPYTRAHQAGATHQQLADVLQPERVCGHLPAGFDSAAYKIPPFHIQRFIKDGEVIDLGDRRLEIIAIPGHTPDSLCLLDRRNKLLFTGDTFYAGPIFLYVPETNAQDYRHSVTRLAALVPQLDLLLPSHNFPEAKPEMLVRLSQALQQIESGAARYKTSEGRREYIFDGFSILTADKK